MLADLDSLLTALYVLVDDFLPVRSGAGHRPKITDAELITLASRRSCFSAIPSGGFCVSPAGGWGTCSPTSPDSPATTSACEHLLPGFARSSTSWPGSPHRSVTGCGCWTPRPCRAAPRVRRSSALSLPAGAPTSFGCCGHDRGRLAAIYGMVPASVGVAAATPRPRSRAWAGRLHRALIHTWRCRLARPSRRRRCLRHGTRPPRC